MDDYEVLAPVIRQRILEAMTSEGITYEQLGEKTGVAKSSINRWVTGKTQKFSLDNIVKICKVLSLDVPAVLGWNKTSLPNGLKEINPDSFSKVPLIGSVAAGTPILAEESYDAYIDCPCKADYALRISGDSMNPNYLDGDVVFIRTQDTIDYDGQVLVVLLDDSATLKHVYRQSNGLLLISDNPSYQPMFMPFDEYNTVRVLGKPVGFTRMFKE